MLFTTTLHSKKYGKKLILILLLFATAQSIKAQWVEKDNGLYAYGGYVFSLATNGNTVIAGTVGGGIFRSTDNGSSWATANSGFFARSLVVNGSTVLGGGSGVFLSTDNGSTWAAINNGLTNTTVYSVVMVGSNFFAGTDAGVFLSTDNGANWAAVNNGLTISTIYSLTANGSNLFAGTASNGVFLSTDNGTSWTAVNNGLTNLSVYCMLANEGNIFAGTLGGGIFLSTNNGSNWTAVNNGLTVTSLRSLATNGSTLFAGTLNGGVFFSTDNGANWTAGSGVPNSPVYAMAANGSTVFAGDNGAGVFRSTDSGATWAVANNGITNGSVSFIGGSSSNLFAGTSSGLFLSADNGASWVANNGLTNLKSLMETGGNLFAGTFGGGVFISSNNGTNWAAVNNGLTTTSVTSMTVGGSNLFAGTSGGVFLSSDNGANWTAVNNGLTTTYVTSMTVSGSNLFAGTSGGGVFLSMDNGTNWAAVNNGLTNTNVTSMIVSGSNLFAGTGNGVFLSTDNGTNWTLVNDSNGDGQADFNGLKNISISSLIFSGGNLFAGTGSGVFLTSNNGTNWSMVNNGLTNTGTTSLTVRGSNLFAAVGQGVWSRSLSDFVAITSFTPTSGVMGTTVTITGINFDPTPENNTVSFNGTASSVDASNSTSITTSVPMGAISGPISVKVNDFTAFSTSSFTINYVVQDSLALVALYNSTNGAAWRNNTNWLTGSLSTWFGVTLVNQRVDQLDLNNNNLVGTIPLELGNLTSLTNLYLSGNQLSGDVPSEFNNLDLLQILDMTSNSLSGLPDLTGMAAISSLFIGDNLFTFEDILPNVGLPTIYYSPQKNIPIANVNVLVGAALNVSTAIGGSGNVYQWSRNSVIISSATSASYSVASASLVDAGNYQITVTNPDAPPLTLTATLSIHVLSLDAADDSGYKFWKKLGAEALGITQIQPGGRANVDNLGNYYFVSSTNTGNGTLIQKADPSGNLLYTMISGNQDIAGTDIAIDGQNSIYVPGPNYATMKKFNSSGTLVFETTAYSGYRPFQTITVDLDGSILAMLGSSSGLINRFDSQTGDFLEQISLTGGPVDYYGVVFDFDLDASGNIYVPDGNRIDKYSPAGVFISSVDVSVAGGWGALILQVAGNGHLYVAPWLAGYTGKNNTIYHFDDNGIFVNKFDFDFTNIALSSLTISASNEIIVSSGIGIFKFDLNGNFLGLAEARNANGQFSFPVQVANDSKGNRYVVDQYNNRIQKFDSKGNFSATFGAFGSDDGQFDKPSSVAIDNLDNIFVADAGNNRIQKFTTTGTHLLSWGAIGSADGQFSNPLSVSFSPSGFLYVADANNYRIQKFTTTGTHVLSFGSQGVASDQFSGNPSIIANENDGNILVIDQTNVKRFSEAGQFINLLDLSGYGTGNLSTDRSGYFYVTTPTVVWKFDQLGGLITTIGNGQNGTADGEFQAANSVSSNIAGDTLWITDYQLNRLSIFTANFRKASVPDSLALVDLYNNTNGPGWTNKTNWLTGTVDTWQGVTMSGGKIRDINLPNNLLKGTLPNSLTTLDNLLTLDLHTNNLSGAWPDWAGPSAMSILDLSSNQLSGPLATLPPQLQQVNLSNNKLTAVTTLPPVINVADLSKNKLTQLGNMSNASMDTLKVQNNNLAFGDLEPNISIPVFIYSPQDSVDLAESILKQVNDTQTFNAVLSGTANAYQWQKNGTAISGQTNTSLTLSNISFKDDATYTYASTNSIVPGLTLLSHKKTLRVSSLQRDSIALMALFIATNGSGWLNHTNWGTTPIGTGNWFGVTISNNRVVAVNLPSDSLAGVVPTVFADLQELTTVDLSSNQIKSMPDLTVIPGLVTLNVSSNALDFASLIANVAITGINYPNQAKLGNPSKADSVKYGTNYNVSVSTKGAGNVYQWTRNGDPVPDATDSTFQITAINRKNMGDYVCEVTNPQVPSLKLKSWNKRVLAVATLSGKFLLPDSTRINNANILLFKINPVGAYDTAKIKPISSDGTFVLDKVVLDDYELLGKPDTIAFPTALPSYYKSTIFWEVADTLSVNGNRSGLNITAVTRPTLQKGNGSISGIFGDDGSSIGGREQAKKRVAGAGVSASRAEGQGRTQARKYILVAYTETNANGEFRIEQLLPDGYRLNIQYPGYPMDTTSFIDFTIGTLPSTKEVIVAAKVTNNKIVVTFQNITGLEEGDNRFSIYPNPTQLVLNIDLNEPMSDVRFEVSTITGQKMITGKLNESGPNQINVSSLSAGIYIVELIRQGLVIKSFRIVLE